MQSTSGPVLVVRSASAEVMRLPIGAQRIVVGRSPQVGAHLEHSLVSRQHAEFWRDDSGRFHLRDLKSRNGTLLNGKPVSEAGINPGDQISIGPFMLQIVDVSPEQDTVSTRMFLSDGSDGRISTLKEHASPQIDLLHLTALNEMTRTLMATENENQRLQILCDVMVGPHFHGRWSIIVRAGG